MTVWAISWWGVRDDILDWHVVAVAASVAAAEHWVSARHGGVAFAGDTRADAATRTATVDGVVVDYHFQRFVVVE